MAEDGLKPSPRIFAAMLLVAQSCGDVSLAYEWLQQYRVAAAASPDAAAAAASLAPPAAAGLSTTTPQVGAGLSQEEADAAAHAMRVAPYHTVIAAASFVADAQPDAARTAAAAFQQLLADGHTPTSQIVTSLIRCASLAGDITAACEYLALTDKYGLKQEVAMFLPIVRCAGGASGSEPCMHVADAVLDLAENAGVAHSTPLFVAYAAAACDAHDPERAAALLPRLEAANMAVPDTIFESIVVA
ncbi:hypothetical protein EON68_05090, partial [archaeon]